jgi:SAM-dependent methyltransferase
VGLRADRELEGSPVVANNAMNRERGLDGVNSYTKDLGFSPLEFLRGREAAAWLDLCCGSGRALVQAAGKLPGARLVGVDLVGYFDPHGDLPGLELVTGSIGQWQPDGLFDLITCVHGLHYVGDKLGLLSRVVSWLKPGGVFTGQLDLANVRIDGEPVGAKVFRNEGLDYDSRRRLLSCRGPARFTHSYEYLGADDRAGPNYTGQPAVASHYRSRGSGPEL